MSKVNLSIIIVNFNTRQVTKDCLESILKSLKNTKISYEIVMVDNASADGSIEMLKKYEAKLRGKFKLILSEVNLGFGKGNNLGVKYAESEYILFLNTDILVLGNAIEDLYNFYKQQTLFKFVGGKLLNKDMTPQQSCAHFFSLPIVFAALFLRGDYWGLTRSSPSKIKRVDWVSGACMITKKRYFSELEGFDREIFMYMEEVDLLYRARARDYLTGFYPRARFIHFGSVSSGGRTYPIIQVYSGFIYFYKKHRSKLELHLLKVLLKLKALISLSLGKLLGNNYLIETYGKAYKMV